MKKCTPTLIALASSAVASVLLEKITNTSFSKRQRTADKQSSHLLVLNMRQRTSFTRRDSPPGPLISAGHPAIVANAIK